MSFLSEQIIKLTRRFYPDGRAFNFPTDGILDRLHKSLNVSEEAAYLDATGVLNTILPDNDNFTEDDATDWEGRLGITLRDGVSLEDRKAAIFRKMNHPSDKFERAHYLFIQKQLQLAGFKVWVYENRFPDGGGGYFSQSLYDYVQGYYDPSYLGTIQHGQVQHGQAQGFSAFEKVANHLSNAEDSAVIVPNGRQTFFIGGDEVGKFANVFATREKEFRKLILQLKPVESAALLAISYGNGLFDDLISSHNPTAMDYNLKFVYRGVRLYYQTATNTTIRVWDIPNDVELGGEAFGGGTIVSSISIHVDSWNSKAYVLDVGGTPIVRVYDLTTGAAIPGENFGSGTVTANSKNITIYEGEAFVYDSGGTGSIFVFTVATGALDRTLNVTSTDIKEIAVNEVEPGTGRIYATDGGATDELRVFSLDGVEDETKTVTGLNNPEGMTIENGILYLCNNGEGVVRIYDVFRGKVEQITPGITTAGNIQLSISNDSLIISDGVNINLHKKNT